MFQRTFAIGMMVFLIACYVNKPSNGSGTSFENDLAPLLSDNCASSGCHDATTSTAGLNLEVSDSRLAGDVFADISAANLLNTSSPELSTLLTQAADADKDDPHGGGEIFAVDGSQYNALLDWITAGALNDDCTAVTHGFATDVVPAFANCNSSGCHDADANLSLIEANAFASIQSNDVLNTNSPIDSPVLQYALGNQTHPPGAVFTSPNEDDFRTIFCWIKVDQGMEN